VRRTETLDMRIGILGSGLMGAKLGTIFTRAGHDVVFSYSRSQQKLKRLARKAGAHAEAGTPREAAEHADALLLAVHWSQVDDVLRQAGNLASKVIVTCSLPMNAEDTRLVIAHTSSGAESLAKKVRKAAIVSGFGTVPSEVLFAVFDAKRRRQRRPSLMYCGDDQAAKRVTASLIRDVGFDPVDAGPLRIARYLEPFTLAIAQLAYEGDGGPEIAYRIERFGQQKNRA
jgi:predicted dinucleotide-binding enzyme